MSLLTALGFGLRAFHMNAQSLWFDEIGSVTVATTPLAELSRAITTGNGVEPTAWLSTGYNALLKLILLVPHDSPDLLLRLSSVVIGTATIPLFAWTAAAIVPPRAAVVATALLALSPLHVWYSQEVRPYAALLLLVVLALGALARALASNEIRWWVLVGIAAAGALYTHPIAIGLAGIIGLVLLAHYREPAVLLRGMTALVAAGATLVPIVLLVRAHGANASADLRPTGVLDLLYAFYAYAVGFSLGPSTTELHTLAPRLLLGYAPLIAVVAVVFGGLALAGARAALGLPRRSLLLLAAWLALPFSLTAAIALLTANPFNVRYAIVPFPAFLLLIALGLDGLRPHGSLGAHRALAAALALAIVALSSVSLANLYLDPRYAKEDTRDLAAMLRTEAAADDVVVVNASYMAQAVRYYYPGPARVVGYPAGDGVPVDAEKAARDLTMLAAGRARVWLVLTRTFHGDRAGTLEQVLRARLPLQVEHRFPGIAAYCFAARE